MCCPPIVIVGCFLQQNHHSVNHLGPSKLEYLIRQRHLQLQ
jgi:hypothetical protein